MAGWVDAKNSDVKYEKPAKVDQPEYRIADKVLALVNVLELDVKVFALALSLAPQPLQRRIWEIFMAYTQLLSDKFDAGVYGDNDSLAMLEEAHNIRDYLNDCEDK